MHVNTYTDAGSFLEDTQAALELNEAANSLMLGVCLRLARHPERIEEPPCLKTVVDGAGLVLTAMMTPPHKLVVYGHRGDLEGGARALVDDLAGAGWTVPGVLGPRAVAAGVAEGWAAATGQGYRVEQRLRVYELRQVTRPVPERGRLRLATAADQALVARWRYAFHEDVSEQVGREEARRAAERSIAQEQIYLWDDQGPVSMAMKTRPTRSGISVTLVYTPPELRGRGYATACVGALSRLLLASGWDYCALFVNRSNVAAKRVYERVGYEPICDYDAYIFE